MITYHRKQESTSMILDDAEAIALGREVVKRGQLLQLRTRLGLTVNAMAELLHTVWPTYKTWETRPVVLRAKTAARVGRFYDQATAQLEMLAEDGIHVHELVPFHIVATLLGIPQEQLLYRYRNGEFEAVDLGILGLWLYQSDLDGLKE